MDELKQWHTDTLGGKTVNALINNGFTASYYPTREQALADVLDHISAGATIGIGGSRTITELGLIPILEEKGHIVYDHNKPGLSPQESMEYRRKELLCDCFLTSSNAITLDGRLVNTDGAGNRVAAMVFGPKQVIVIAGINKVAASLVQAEERVKNFAAPINNKRLSKKNPCVRTGQCMDCSSSERICNVTTVVHKKPSAINIHIVLIGDSLGF